MSNPKHRGPQAVLKTHLRSTDGALETCFVLVDGAIVYLSSGTWKQAEHASAEQIRRTLAKYYGRGYDFLPVCKCPDEKGLCFCDKLALPCTCGNEDFYNWSSFCAMCGRRIERKENG